MNRTSLQYLFLSLFSKIVVVIQKCDETNIYFQVLFEIHYIFLVVMLKTCNRLTLDILIL